MGDSAGKELRGSFGARECRRSRSVRKAESRRRARTAVRVVIKVPNPDWDADARHDGAQSRRGRASLAGHVCIQLSALVTHSPEAVSRQRPGQLGVFASDGKAMKRRSEDGDIFSSSILVTEGLRAGEEL